MAKPARRATSKLWACPRCGHRFVTRNLWHSCVRIPLRTHFAGARATLRPAYRAVLAAARRAGPVRAYAQKTRIVLQARVRFASVIVRAGSLDLGLWLRRRVEHPRMIRTESLGRLGFGVHFRVAAPGDIDSALRALIREARRAGAPSRTR